MTTTLVAGPSVRKLSIDKDGHRTYTVEHRVLSDDGNDGPVTVGFTAGLPTVASIWNFGNDFDAWAYCWPNAEITKDDEAKWPTPSVWKVTQKFSTKPFNRCQTTPPGNPVLEPMKISGSFVRGTIIPRYDRFGDAIASSSHEPLVGIEFDESTPAVVIEQNVLVLGLADLEARVNTVNSVEMWGMAVRTIKLSDAPWKENYYGTCNVYYTRTLNFDVDQSTFDRNARDQGHMVLKPGVVGTGGGEKDDPTNFVRNKDQNDENTTLVALDGNGNAATSPAGAAVVNVQHYDQSNHLGLGIPAIIG